MLISILSETNIFYIAKEYIFNLDYRNDFIKNSDIPFDSKLDLLNILKFELKNFKWSYDYIIIWGTNIFQLLIPIFAAIAALIFYKKNKTIKFH